MDETVAYFDHDAQAWTIRMDKDAYDELLEALTDTERGEYWPRCQELLDAMLDGIDRKGL